jgi:hypothetical protein
MEKGHIGNGSSTVITKDSPVLPALLVSTRIDNSITGIGSSADIIPGCTIIST